MIPTVIDSVQEAVRLVQSGNPFDAVALDIDMPEIDGMPLARIIRKYNKTLPLLTLAFMGQRIEPDLSDVTLIKPIKLSQLHNALIAVFAARAAPIERDCANYCGNRSEFYAGSAG